MAKWKLCFHWLVRVRQRRIVLALHVPIPYIYIYIYIYVYICIYIYIHTYVHMKDTNTVPVDVLAPNGAKPSTDTAMTTQLLFFQSLWQWFQVQTVRADDEISGILASIQVLISPAPWTVKETPMMNGWHWWISQISSGNSVIHS